MEFSVDSLLLSKTRHYSLVFFIYS